MSEGKTKFSDELLEEIAREHAERKLRNRLYTYEDMLAAYWMGQRSGAETNNDVPDFATFIRKHVSIALQNEKE